MSPILLCIPSAGTFVPREYAEAMTKAGLATRENWFLMEKAGHPPLQSCGLIASNISRHVVDLDCDPSAKEVCPVETAQGKAIYLDDQRPDPEQIQQRVEHYWQPFYDQLDEELMRMVEQFGKARVIHLRSGKDTRLAASRESQLAKAVAAHEKVKIDDIVLFSDTDPKQIESLLKNRKS